MDSTPGAPHTHDTSPPTNTPHATARAVDVEMSDLETERRLAGPEAAEGSRGLLNDVEIPQTSPMTSTFPAIATGSMAPAAGVSEPSRTGDVSTEAAQSTAIPTTTIAHNDTTTTTEAASIPTDSSIEPAVLTPAITSAGPVLIITLLLGTGARHPYKIDEKYLTKRNVSIPGETEGGRKDPFSISVYTLKELILREWREEWEAQPSSPSAIRLIYFGRLLDDKTPLKECRFNAESANVVHMTVRPQDMVDDEEASKSKAGARDREGGESTAGCRCVVQ